jgi:1A family penicillin-binding protein
MKTWYRSLSRKRKIALFAVSVLIAVGLFLYFWLFYDLPSIDRLRAGMALPSTRIFDRDGVLLYEIFPPEGGRNTAIPLSDVPQHCIDAVIATEDANYYAHPGVDAAGVLRAAWINLQGGEVLAGGSTITQQLARTLLFDPEQRAERTLRRKLREMILAVQLSTVYSKDAVLEMYLNQVYFGNLAYGIEAAAQAYFGKSAAALSLAECALLAGVLQNPSAYDPLSNLEAARERQDVALRLMVERDLITVEQADAARNDALQFAPTPFPIEAPHFVMAVIKQLERDYGEVLFREGLDVITTVDLDWQRAAQEAVQQQLTLLNHPPFGGRPPANANNAALVAIDPFTGQVLTMLGSPDYFDESIDGAVNAALALRQPGSTLKPFTYAAGMDPDLPEPFTPATLFLDVETPFVTRRLESYTPGNFGLVEHGPVLLREALGSSYNIPAVAALDQIGIERFIQLANRAGLSTLADNPRLDLAITLGGGEVRLLDLTQAYSIFPNGGYRIDPVYILRVTTRSGTTLYASEQAPLTQQVIDEQVAYLITDILADNNARIPNFGANSAMNIGRPAAAKTGTTTDYRDNWIVGYTPNLVVGVWVGNADNTPMVDVTGVSGTAPIWNQFMRRVLLGQPELAFREPDGLVRVEVCALSGMLPTPLCPLRRTEIFIAGTQPTQPDTFYQQFAHGRAGGCVYAGSIPAESRVYRAATGSARLGAAEWRSAAAAGQHDAASVGRGCSAAPART